MGDMRRLPTNTLPSSQLVTQLVKGAGELHAVNLRPICSLYRRFGGPIGGVMRRWVVRSDSWGTERATATRARILVGASASGQNAARAGTDGIR
jgi:hypothetical protein